MPYTLIDCNQERSGPPHRWQAKIEDLKREPQNFEQGITNIEGEKISKFDTPCSIFDIRFFVTRILDPLNP
jgi:hypothetical protein